ncbi:hypothetical protein DFH09DRAFT_1434727 [Mycena vulgaris]|nr:hypothetical protein DFH09DRAFT_1434727 [Mycena vulgaris]
MAHSMFPTMGLQALNACLYLIGVTILTFCISRRLLEEDFITNQPLARLSWPRICALLVFVDSYLFIFSTGFLIFGVGLQLNETACAAGINLCVSFYCSSKILIYCFLTEKVYIVWGVGSRRMRSPVYLLCLITVFLYMGIVVALLFGRIKEFRSGDGACVLGLKPAGSIALLSYDLYINILLTGLFMWPLMRSNHVNVRLKRVAHRTLVAAGVALTTSTVNIAVLTIMKGRELGWVCLASCGTDVIFNAGALFWVTGRTSHGTTLSASELNRQPNDNTSILALPSARSPKNPSSNAFKMSNLSPKEMEFQIRVTTESHVDHSPRMAETYGSNSEPSA